MIFSTSKAFDTNKTKLIRYMMYKIHIKVHLKILKKKKFI